MLFSAVVDPKAFSSEAINDVDSAKSALSFLYAVMANGVLLSSRLDDILRELLEEASKPVSPDSIDHRVALRTVLTEMRKGENSYVVKGVVDPPSRGRGSIEAQLLRSIAVDLKPDLVVSKNEADRDSLVATVEAEVCEISRYLYSEMERERVKLLSPRKPFNKLSQTDREENLGKLIRYAKRIFIVDKMVGRHLRGDSVEMRKKQIRPILEGAARLVHLWRDERFAYKGKEAVEIILYTEAKNSSHADGLKIPVQQAIEETGEVFEEVWEKYGSGKCKFSVELRTDGEKQEFHARFLSAVMDEGGAISQGRCVQIDPGMKALGKILQGNDHTMLITPPCGANSEAVAIIDKLASCCEPPRPPVCL